MKRLNQRISTFHKLLEIRTSDIDLVIKSKNIQTAVAACADEQSSSVAITTFGLERIKVGIQNIDLNFENSGNYSAQIINVAPLFFEQTDYELIVNSRNGKAVHFWNENYLIREKIGPVIEGNNTLVTGIINFGNSVGYTDLEITADDRKVMVLRIEVYPSKITYKEDYQRMIADVSEMVYAAAIDFMQKTYQEFSIGDKQNNVPAIFFQIIFMIFEKYMNAAKRITTVPHHKLITERTVVPEYKAKRTDRKSEKWLMTHQRNIAMDQGGDLVVNRVLASRKQITYDTNENRFVKFILKATIRKLEDFITRYKKSVKNPEETVLLETNRMINKVRNILNTSFLREVSEYYAEQSMSLVFGMAPGYRELYKHYLMIQRGLSVHGDFFRISVKDTAQLYEYWCFIKLFTLLKNQYQLVSPDIIKIDNSGITVTLVKGKRSKARFINPKTGELITLIYNPGETKTQTVNQKPDNVLELEKKGTEVSYKYVFDAKYRIEKEPENSFYPDSNNNLGPKVDDINTMHRYRDSIVYENKVSKFTFEKTMFGAYVLFPYDDEELYNVKRYDLIYKYYKKYHSKRALGFCSSRMHAEEMAKEFCRRGVKSVAVYSNADGEFSEERNVAIEQLKNQEIKVIFSVDMFNEGVDIASLDMVMFLRPTESPTVFLQQLGRGLRISKGKEYVNVLDFIGNYEKAGRAPFLLNGGACAGERTAYDYSEIEYPDDCIVDFDMHLIDLFREMDEKSLSIKERIKQEYYRVKELLDGKVPTRTELFTNMDDHIYEYCMKHSKENPFK